MAVLLGRHGDHRSDPRTRAEGPASAWTPAVEADGEARDGAWAAEVTGKLMDGRLKGMRLIV